MILFHYFLLCFKICVNRLKNYKRSTRFIINYYRQNLLSFSNAKSFHTIYRYFQILWKFKYYNQSAILFFHDYRCLENVYSRSNIFFKFSKKLISWRYSTYRCRKQKQKFAFFEFNCNFYDTFRKKLVNLKRTLKATQFEMWKRKRIYKKSFSLKFFLILIFFSSNFFIELTRQIIVQKSLYNVH